MLARDAFSRELLPYWLTGYALWLSELQRVDIGHLRNGSIILVLLFFALCERHRRAYPKHVAFGVIACLLLNGMVNVAAAAMARVPIHSRNGTLYSYKKDSALEFLLRHTERGENVFVYPYRPIYYFLADVRNPTRFSYLQYHFDGDEQFLEAIRDLERTKVRYALWDTIFAGENMTREFPAYCQPPREQLIMEPYLESHYRQIGFENGLRILERKQ